LRKLSQLGREIHYSRGCFVFRENEKAESFFVLLDGEVQVFKGIRGKGQVGLRSLKPCCLFGEMSFFTGKRRTASCQALQRAVVLEVPHNKFKKLLKEGDQTASKLIHLNCQHLADRLSHILDLIGHDMFSASIENPVFRKMKFFWAV
jgi:CRP-like cAMP-binding protein